MVPAPGKLRQEDCELEAMCYINELTRGNIAVRQAGSTEMESWAQFLEQAMERKCRCLPALLSLVGLCLNGYLVSPCGVWFPHHPSAFLFVFVLRQGLTM